MLETCITMTFYLVSALYGDIISSYDMLLNKGNNKITELRTILQMAAIGKRRTMIKKNYNKVLKMVIKSRFIRLKTM